MNNELYHHGIKGMRWGIRRYQNKDGSLTPAGKRRVSQLDAEREALVGTKAKTENKPKTFREMSTDELREQINRRRMEKEYLELNKQVSDLAPAEVSLGKRIFSHLASKVIVPAATDAGKKFLTDFLNKEGAKALGLDKEAAKPLKDVVADLNLKKQKIELDKYFESYKQEQASKTKKSKPNDSSKKTDSESKDTKSEKTKTSDTPSSEPKKETTNEAKTSTQNKSSEPKTKQKTETYTGEIFGEGTSHKTFTENEAKRKDSGTIYTYDFTDKSTSDPSVERSVVLGRQYVAGLLEERKR